MASAHERSDRILLSPGKCAAEISHLQELYPQLCRQDQSAEICYTGVDGIDTM